MYYANGFIEYKGYLIELEWDDGYRGIVHGLDKPHFYNNYYHTILEHMKQQIDKYEQTK